MCVCVQGMPRDMFKASQPSVAGIACYSCCESIYAFMVLNLYINYCYYYIDLYNCFLYFIPILIGQLIRHEQGSSLSDEMDALTPFNTKHDNEKINVVSLEPFLKVKQDQFSKLVHHHCLVGGLNPSEKS